MAGKIIKQLRRDSGLTQAELGNKLGVIKQTVSSWENDISSPSNETLSAIAELFGVTVDYILCNNTGSARVEHSGNYCFFHFSDLLKDVFVERIGKLLSEKKLTTEELSEIVPFPKERCIAYINGESEPSLEDLIDISQALDVSTDFLLGQIPAMDSTCKKLMNTFVKLNEDNKDIIIGKSKELLKEQNYEESVAADKEKRKVSGK